MKTRVHRNQTILWDHHHFLISNCIKMFYFNEAKSLWFSSSFSMQGYVAVCSRKWHYTGKQSLCNNSDIAKMIFFLKSFGLVGIFFFFFWSMKERMRVGISKGKIVAFAPAEVWVPVCIKVSPSTGPIHPTLPISHARGAQLSV